MSACNTYACDLEDGLEEVLLPRQHAQLVFQRAVAGVQLLDLPVRVPEAGARA